MLTQQLLHRRCRCAICVYARRHVSTEVNSFFHFFFFNDTATTEIYTLSLHDALPILGYGTDKEVGGLSSTLMAHVRPPANRSEEHTSELQSHLNLVCRLLLEKNKTSP